MVLRLAGSALIACVGAASVGVLRLRFDRAALSAAKVASTFAIASASPDASFVPAWPSAPVEPVLFTAAAWPALAFACSDGAIAAARTIFAAATEVWPAAVLVNEGSWPVSVGSSDSTPKHPSWRRWSWPPAVFALRRQHLRVSRLQYSTPCREPSRRFVPFRRRLAISELPYRQEHFPIRLCLWMLPCLMPRDRPRRKLELVEILVANPVVRGRRDR